MLTPSSRRTDEITRRAILAGGVAVLSATAGCTDFLEDDDDADANEELVADAPAESTVLAHLETAAIPEENADEVLADLESVEARYVDAATTSLEARTGLDPLESDEILAFGDGSDTDVIVDGDWSDDDVVSSTEDATGLEYEETTHADESVLYQPGGDSTEDGDEPAHLGVLGDGRFVVGSETDVRTALDVRYEGSDAISGPVREAYDDALGAQLTVASISAGQPIPEEYRALVPSLSLEIFEEIEAVGRSYEVVDEGIALEIDLYAPDDPTAGDLETTIRGALAALAELDREFDEAREDVVLERDGPVVRVSYEGDAEVVFELLDGV